MHIVRAYIHCHDIYIVIYYTYGDKVYGMTSRTPCRADQPLSLQVAMLH